jgi:hypothetical protein
LTLGLSQHIFFDAVLEGGWCEISRFWGDFRMETTVDDPQWAESEVSRKQAAGLPVTPMSREGIHFPLGFSAQEQELWFEAEEQAQALALQQIEVIKRGDTKLRYSFEQELSKNCEIRAVLQQRLDELGERERRGHWRNFRPVTAVATPAATKPVEDAPEIDSDVEDTPLRDVSLFRTPGPATKAVERPRSSGKVPRDLPHFRGSAKDAIQEAAEFMERFDTICEPHALDDAQLMKILPICLDQVDGAWFKQWRQQNQTATWKDARHAFLAHFKHPNELTVLLAQIRVLKMDATGVQRYADQFRRLMAQLGWTKSTPEAIFQFKQGLTRWMLDRLSGAEANWELWTEMAGQPGNAITVDALVTIALKIEADRALITTGEVSRTTQPVGSSNGEEAKRETRGCRYCHKSGHLERD